MNDTTNSIEILSIPDEVMTALKRLGYSEFITMGDLEQLHALPDSDDKARLLEHFNVDWRRTLASTVSPQLPKQIPGSVSHFYGSRLRACDDCPHCSENDVSRVLCYKPWHYGWKCTIRWLGAKVHHFVRGLGPWLVLLTLIVALATWIKT